jgi:glycosyltransferase involved in cell wall biosynthesis
MRSLEKLVIISHTEHRIGEDGLIYGWGPTVEEINYLSCFFKDVTHVACIEKSSVIPGSYRKYNSDNIEYLPIPQFGGKTVLKKLLILFKAKNIIKQVEKALDNATHVQLRVPMGIAVFLIPYFVIRKKEFIFWIKYANNWGDPSPKLGFRIQRYLLKKNFLKCKVTVNGFWPNQPDHIISFENPCLYKREILNLSTIKIINKHTQPFNLLFVGRVEEEKGVGIVIDWIVKYKPQEISVFTIIGEGKDYDYYHKYVEKIGLEHKIKFLGSKSREELQKLYMEYDMLVLPSFASEGFPKVVAEAMAFGCVPIVSEVSSLKNFLEKSSAAISWSDFSENGLYDLCITDQLLTNGLNWAEKFTFENYLNRLRSEVFVNKMFVNE